MAEINIALAVLSFLILVGLSIWGITRYRERQRRRRQLFTWGYEQNHNKITQSLTLKTSPEFKDIKIKLTLFADITLQFITVSIVGGGDKPGIFDPRDYSHDGPHIGVEYFRYGDGGLNITFRESQQRTAGQHIYIGIKCFAQKPFSGAIKVSLKCNEVDNKELSLPFIVEDKNLSTN
jgi:hypothetical protein